MRGNAPIVAVALLVACGGPAAPGPARDGGTGGPADPGAPATGPAPAGDGSGPGAGDVLERCALERPLVRVPPVAPPSTDCGQILRPLPSPQLHRTFVDGAHRDCTVRGGDASGTLAVLLESHRDDAVPSLTWELVSPGGTGRRATLPPALLFPRERGFVAYDAAAGTLQDLDEAGSPTCAPVAVPDPALVAIGPRGGLVVRAPWPTALATRSWAGVDDEGRVLVLEASSPLEPTRSLRGRWFDADGAPLTEPFVVADLTPGDAGWLDVAAVYGGIALRMGSFAQMIGQDSRWIAVVPSGVAGAEPPPAWLAARPSTRLLRTRGGYAVVAEGYFNAACGDHIEILSAAGEACGVLDLSAGDARSCARAAGVDVGLDGTLVQQLPTAFDPLDPTRASCTIRSWPAALP